MDPVSDPKSCTRYIMPVHNMHHNPFPKKGNLHLTHDVNCESIKWSHEDGVENVDDTNTLVRIELSEPQQQVIYSWSHTMFLK